MLIEFLLYPSLFFLLFFNDLTLFNLVFMLHFFSQVYIETVLYSLIKQTFTGISIYSLAVR